MRKGKSLTCYALVHVDDFAFVFNSEPFFEEIFDILKSKYSFSSHGPLSWFLGMRILHDGGGVYSLSQELYIDQVCERFASHMDAKAVVSAPWHAGQPGKLSMEFTPKTLAEKNLVKDLPYAQIVGALQWLVTCGRPDIGYAVSAVALHLLFWPSSFRGRHPHSLLLALYSLTFPEVQAFSSWYAVGVLCG